MGYIFDKTFLYKFDNAIIFAFFGFGIYILDRKIEKFFTPFNLYKIRMYTDPEEISYYHYCVMIKFESQFGLYGIAVPIDKPKRQFLNVSKFVQKMVDGEGNG